MAVGFSNTNKPLNPRGQDASPKGYNRAALYSGKALDFDGANDYVDLDGFTLSGTTATISFYYNTDSSKAFAYIFDNSQRWVIGQADTTDSFGFYDGSTWRKSTQTLTLGEWYHITAVIDGGNVEFLWNGESVGDTFTGANSISWASLTTFKLGWSFNASGIGQVNGQLSGFKIFNTALTAEQIADLYNNPEKVVPTGLESNLKLWLPMMEGAGTTAYDGSGNGNHGTISGATYVNGIGAPSPQSAVMDWNKGSNIYSYSNEFDEWTKANATITADYAISPDGTQNATRVEMTPGGIMYISATGSSGDNTLSVWAKSTTGTGAQFRFFGNGNTISSGLQTTTDEWQRFEYTFTYSAVTAGIKGDDDILFFGFQHEISSEAGAYIPTIGNTTQPTPVLLPQGLTTGRDITGVNLFENVRKQGALNLDGNSWAEVHDNESVDLTTGATLEAWVYWDDSVSQGILSKWNYGAGKASYLILKISEDNFRFYVSSTGSNATLIENTTTITSGWNHIVGVYDGTNIKCYLNGSVDGSTAYSAGLFPNDLNLEIGKYGSEKYPNAIAQPRIYNRALTAEEVLRNYNSGKNTYK